MELTLAELARRLEARLEGDGRVVIRGLNGVNEAVEGQLTFLTNGKYAPALARSRASAVILADDSSLRPRIPVLRAADPDLAFARAAQILSADEQPYPFRADGPPQVHPTAVVHASVKLGRGVQVGAHAVLEPGVEIGEQTVLYPQTYVGHQSRIGARCLIYPRVVIRERCQIGQRVIIQPGAVIGSDGFGYVVTRDGQIVKVPQLGIVVIGDDVEIGANATIDRARVDRTVLHAGVKIDNLVQIAHNVSIGDCSMIAAQTGIAGSTKIGRRVVMGGQAGLLGHIEVGDGSKIGAQAGVTKSFPANSVLWGTPARAHRETLRDQALVRRVPELVETIRRIAGGRSARTDEKNKKDDRPTGRD
jgi:UDP-3-O-[3-hydroxymyristoyl] glucosamine N-acyltransferase